MKIPGRLRQLHRTLKSFHAHHSPRRLIAQHVKTKYSSSHYAAPPAGNIATEQSLRPSSRVLGITELLENILLFLPLSDMLCAKRVSKQFRDTIDRSLYVRRALFFEPLSYSSKNELAIMDNYKPIRVAGLESLPEVLPKYIAVNPLLARFLKN